MSKPENKLLVLTNVTVIGHKSNSSLLTIDTNVDEEKCDFQLSIYSIFSSIDRSIFSRASEIMGWKRRKYPRRSKVVGFLLQNGGDSVDNGIHILHRSFQTVFLWNKFFGYFKPWWTIHSNRGRRWNRRQNYVAAKSAFKHTATLVDSRFSLNFFFLFCVLFFGICFQLHFQAIYCFSTNKTKYES